MTDLDRLVQDSLRSVRDEHVRQIEPEVHAAKLELARKVRGRRWAFGAGATALTAAALAAVVFVAQTLPGQENGIGPSGYPTIVASIDVSTPQLMAAGAGGKMWVSHPDGVVGIDPATSSIAMESPSGPWDAMAANDDAVFGTTVDGSVDRVPFGTNEAGTGLPAEGMPGPITADDDMVWYASQSEQGDSTSVYAIGPNDFDPTSVFEFERTVVADMTDDDGWLWMAASRVDADLVKTTVGVIGIPPGGDAIENLTTFALTPQDGSPADIAVGAGAVWVLRQPDEGRGNAITRIDIETGEANERAVTLPDSLESIAFGEGYLWATTAPLAMDMPDGTVSTLHRIDPETLEPSGEPMAVSHPGSQVEVGLGYVWVTDPNENKVVQIDPFGAESPAPTPTEEASPTPTPTTSPERERSSECDGFLPFTSSDQSLQIGLGSGGNRDSLTYPQPAPMVHYAGPQGSIVDIVVGDPLWPPFDEQEIEVLGRPASLHRIEDGFAVTFSTGGCDFQLIAYGFSEDEVRSFAGSLGLRGHTPTASDAFTMWPESAPEDAYLACRDLPEGQTFRKDALETALSFARERLGWDAAIPDPNGGVFDMERFHAGFSIAADQTEGAPTVDVFVWEVAPGCWSVTSSKSRLRPGQPTSVSVDKTGDRLRVGFGLDAHSLADEAATLRLQVEGREVTRSVEEFEERGIEVSGFSNDPTSFLLLVEDAEGRVIGAVGMALPSGDLVAG